MVSEGTVTSTSNIAIAALFCFISLSSMTEVQSPHNKTTQIKMGKNVSILKPFSVLKREKDFNSRQQVKKCITFFDNIFNMSVPTKIIVYSNTK